MSPSERADRAREMLASQIFQDMHEAIHKEIVAALETVAFDDIERQHELTLTLQLHNRLKRKLERWVEDGVMDQRRQDQANWIEKARQRFRG